MPARDLAFFPVPCPVCGEPRQLLLPVDEQASVHAAARKRKCQKCRAAANCERNADYGARRGTPKRLKPASKPTASRPGSSDRIEVYEGRVKRGEEVFSEFDTTLFDKEAA